jgi:hypothetical protein
MVAEISERLNILFATPAWLDHSKSNSQQLQIFDMATEFNCYLPRMFGATPMFVVRMILTRERKSTVQTATVLTLQRRLLTWVT